MRVKGLEHNSMSSQLSDPDCLGTSALTIRLLYLPHRGFTLNCVFVSQSVCSPSDLPAWIQNQPWDNDFNHCVVFSGKTLYSYSVSLHPGIQYTYFQQVYSKLTVPTAKITFKYVVPTCIW